MQQSKSANSTTRAPEASSRRRIVGRVAAAAAATAAIGGFSIRSSYLASWGTLDAPVFPIVDSPAFREAPRTYYDRAIAATPSAPCEEAWLAARLPARITEGGSGFLSECIEHSASPSALEGYLEQKYGTPLECARQLFKRLTDKELSTSARVIVVEPGAWPSKSYSGSNHLGVVGVSLVEKQGYLDTLMTVLHELGHQVCPVGESQLLELKNPDLPYSREEAAAYCFVYLSILQFDDPLLRDILVDWFSSRRDSRIRDFQQGPNDEHAVGMALFDAALSLYPPEQAWKKIATGERLDPKILLRLEELRRLLLPTEASR